MFNPVDKVSSYIHSQVISLEKKGMKTFIWEKFQERNPFQYTKEYQKQTKVLKNKLIILKQINRSFRVRLQSYNDPNLCKNINALDKRIVDIKRELSYLKIVETGQTILKLASPCNLIIPGIGDVLRLAAYSVKIGGATDHYIKKHGCLNNIVEIAKEIALAGMITAISQVVYNQVHYLKQCLTYSNFRSFFYYANAV